MMKVAIITLFPEMFEALTQYGVSGRAVERGLIEIEYINPRQYALDRHGTIDDKPYGGGPGMVMMVEPLLKSINQAKAWIGEEHKPRVVYLSPQGQRLDHAAVEQMRVHQHWILIAGRYEGIDERVIAKAVDEEWSIGDYVLSGGELPAMVLLDAMLRWVPGVLGDAQSAQQDSFVEGLLDAPHYTRPEVVDGDGSDGSNNLRVPEVLLSGDHKRIAKWRQQQAIERTQTRRPDLYEQWLEKQGLKDQPK